MTALEKVVHEHLESRLALLTQPQRDFYKRVYPDGPKWDQLLNAESQIENTIKKNAKQEAERC